MQKNDTKGGWINPRKARTLGASAILGTFLVLAPISGIFTSKNVLIDNYRENFKLITTNYQGRTETRRATSATLFAGFIFLGFLTSGLLGYSVFNHMTIKKQDSMIKRTRREINENSNSLLGAASIIKKSYDETLKVYTSFLKSILKRAETQSPRSDSTVCSSWVNASRQKEMALCEEIVKQKDNS